VYCLIRTSAPDLEDVDFGLLRDVVTVQEPERRPQAIAFGYAGADLGVALGEAERLIGRQQTRGVTLRLVGIVLIEGLVLGPDRIVIVGQSVRRFDAGRIHGSSCGDGEVFDVLAVDRLLIEDERRVAEIGVGVERVDVVLLFVVDGQIGTPDEVRLPLERVERRAIELVAEHQLVVAREIDRVGRLLLVGADVVDLVGGGELRGVVRSAGPGATDSEVGDQVHRLARDLELRAARSVHRLISDGMSLHTIDIPDDLLRRPGHAEGVKILRPVGGIDREGGRRA